MKLDQGWGPRASEEILPTGRGAVSRSPPGHAGSARCEPRRALRSTRDPEARQARRAALPRRGGPGTGRVPTSLLSAAARHLQLTSPKFPAPARWPRSVRPRARRARGPSLLGSAARTEQARRRRCWRRGFKETAPSPQFPGPRWGRCRFTDCRSTVDPFPALAAAPPPLLKRQEPSAPAQVSVATCVCTRPKPALGVHVQPRPSVCISGAMRRRWSPGLQEGGGTRGASSRSHTSRTSN